MQLNHKVSTTRPGIIKGTRPRHREREPTAAAGHVTAIVVPTLSLSLLLLVAVSLVSLTYNKWYCRAYRTDHLWLRQYYRLRTRSTGHGRPGGELASPSQRNLLWPGTGRTADCQRVCKGKEEDETEGLVRKVWRLNMESHGPVTIGTEGTSHYH